MRLDLEDQIATAFKSIVALTPKIGDLPSGQLEPPVNHRGKGRLLFAVAAASILLTTLVTFITWDPEPGTITSADRTEPAFPDSEQEAAVPGVPILFETNPGAEVVTLRRSIVDFSTGTLGAVLAPSGTVFGLELGPTLPFDSRPASLEERVLAGHQTWAFVDGSALEEIYRGVEVACATLSITTAEEAMWSADLLTLVQSITNDETSVTLELAEGWRALGVSTGVERYQSVLSVLIDDSTHELWMSQAPGQPIATYLSTMESNPVELETDDGVLWHVAGATTPGLNSIIGERFGTAFDLTGEVPLEVLLEVIETMSPIEEGKWIDLSTPATYDDQMTEVTTAESAANTCELADLWIIESS